MSRREIAATLARAFDELFKFDGELFTLGTDGISEQTLTFRLGHYLQLRFPAHHVDCEYNRFEDEVKDDPYVDQQWMKPDIIVHLRRKKAQNLLVIEAKKAKRWNADYPMVQQKLEAFTRHPGKYEYRIGIAWKIAESEDPSEHRIIWFVDGEMIEEGNLSDFSGILDRFAD